ncbi:hypothetical protein JZ751_024287, partial [Albula glossodonta]
GTVQRLIQGQTCVVGHGNAGLNQRLIQGQTCVVGHGNAGLNQRLIQGQTCVVGHGNAGLNQRLIQGQTCVVGHGNAGLNQRLIQGQACVVGHGNAGLNCMRLMIYSPSLHNKTEGHSKEKEHAATLWYQDGKVTAGTLKKMIFPPFINLTSCIQITKNSELCFKL